MLDEADTINMHKASNGYAARIDAMVRSQNAFIEHADKFDSAHLAVVEEVRDIVNSFFTVKRDIYVNHRANRGKCFSVVKVDKPDFPRMNTAAKQAAFYGPLAALGVEIVFSKNTNSYLFRIPT